MRIFVHRASEQLTDHLPHGDGLICHALLRGLADRGHRIFAYTNDDAVARRSERLTVRAARHRVPANSLAPWEHAIRADRWLRCTLRSEPIDFVWRMHPYGVGCPTVPATAGRPLVVGPLFYDWPGDQPTPSVGRPRLGLGIGPLVQPLARRGWRRTLRAARLVLCATDGHAALLRNATTGRVETLPVLVDTPSDLPPRVSSTPGRVRLVFVGNLVPNKRPLVFCETIAALRHRGVVACGVIVGNGSERAMLERYVDEQVLRDRITFAGSVPNAEVFPRLAAADLLVSTSIGEPYGRNIVEAMSVGTPVVCHRSGGPAELIGDGVDGLLVEDTTADAFASVIQRARADGMLESLGRAAAEKSRAWRSAAVIDRLEELLRETIATTAARS